MSYRFTASEPDPFEDRADETKGAWAAAFAAAQKATELSESGRSPKFAIDWALAEGSDEERAATVLREVADNDKTAALGWRAGAGWELLLPPDDRRPALIELYLPNCRP